MRNKFDLNAELLNALDNDSLTVKVNQGPHGSLKSLKI